MVEVFTGKLSKPTRANSVFVGDRPVIMLKKNSMGKALKYHYVAYDYETGKKIWFAESKELLREWILNNKERIRLFNLDIVFTLSPDWNTSLHEARGDLRLQRPA